MIETWLNVLQMKSNFCHLITITRGNSESCWSHIQIFGSRFPSVFPCNIVRTSAICVRKSIWKVSPVCDKSVRARDALGRYAGVGGWRHYKTSLDYHSPSRPTKSRTPWWNNVAVRVARAVVKEGKRNLSLMGFIFQPPSWCFSLCVPPPRHIPRFSFFPSVDNQLTTSHRRRARLEMIFIRRMERKKSSWNILVVWISALAVFHYDKW